MSSFTLRHIPHWKLNSPAHSTDSIPSRTSRQSVQVLCALLSKAMRWRSDQADDGGPPLRRVEERDGGPGHHLDADRREVRLTEEGVDECALAPFVLAGDEHGGMGPGAGVDAVQDAVGDAGATGVAHQIRDALDKIIDVRRPVAWAHWCRLSSLGALLKRPHPTSPPNVAVNRVSW